MSLHDDLHVLAQSIHNEIASELDDIKQGFADAMINFHNRIHALQERIAGHVQAGHESIAQHEAAKATPTVYPSPPLQADPTPLETTTTGA